MTKQCIKIIMKSDSASQSALPGVVPRKEEMNEDTAARI